MIKFENVNVTYPGGVVALKDLNLEIKDGDFIIIVGLSGAGKSTLLRTINNLVKPTSIKSPSFPILLTYEVNQFEIFHYDLYRISNINELVEINIFEELNNSITLIEWPEIILDSLDNYNYYSVNFTIVDEGIRNIKHNLTFNSNAI